MSNRRRRALLPAVLVGAGIATILVAASWTHPKARSLPHPFTSTSIRYTQQAPPTPPASARAAAVAFSSGDEPPTRLHIAHLDVDAAVLTTPSSGNEITVPTNPAILGWWTVSAPPGSASGSTVIVGHVDSARSGPGALFHLDQIKPGDRIVITVRGGETVAYRTDTLTDIRKTVGLSASLFATGSAPRLVVITCGGPFNELTKSYADNIVITAQPV